MMSEQARVGPQLKSLRKRRRLTLREVEEVSREVVRTRGNVNFLLTAGQLSAAERGTTLPSIFKLATLSEAYKVRLSEILEFYGFESDAKPTGQPIAPVQRTEAAPAKASLSHRITAALRLH